jgi:hypothetical protein
VIEDVAGGRKRKLRQTAQREGFGGKWAAQVVEPCVTSEHRTVSKHMEVWATSHEIYETAGRQTDISLWSSLIFMPFGLRILFNLEWH